VVGTPVRGSPEAAALARASSSGAYPSPIHPTARPRRPSTTAGAWPAVALLGNSLPGAAEPLPVLLDPLLVLRPGPLCEHGRSRPRCSSTLSSSARISMPSTRRARPSTLLILMWSRRPPPALPTCRTSAGCAPPEGQKAHVVPSRDERAYRTSITCLSGWRLSASMLCATVSVMPVFVLQQRWALWALADVGRRLARRDARRARLRAARRAGHTMLGCCHFHSPCVCLHCDCCGAQARGGVWRRLSDWDWGLVSSSSSSKLCVCVCFFVFFVFF